MELVVSVRLMLFRSTMSVSVSLFLTVFHGICYFLSRDEIRIAAVGLLKQILPVFFDSIAKVGYSLVSKL